MKATCAALSIEGLDKTTASAMRGDAIDFEENSVLVQRKLPSIYDRVDDLPPWPDLLQVLRVVDANTAGTSTKTKTNR